MKSINFCKLHVVFITLVKNISYSKVQYNFHVRSSYGIALSDVMAKSEVKSDMEFACIPNKPANKMSIRFRNMHWPMHTVQCGI